MWACCFIPVSLWILSQANFLHFLLKLQSISFLSLFLSSFLSLLLSLSLSFYVVKIFALVGAIPDLIRRISLGIRG